MEPQSHILIIDDNLEILDVVTLMLQRQGFKVSAQSRMADFITEVGDISRDLIPIDKQLGWADGCDLCALVKTNKGIQPVPVIMFSAYHKTEDECRSAGADAFFAKPFDMFHLLETIRIVPK